MTQPVGIPVLTDLEEGKPDVNFIHARYVVTIWDEPNQIGSQMGRELGRFTRRRDAEECIKNPPKDRWYSNDQSESIYGYISEALSSRMCDLFEMAKTKSVGGQLVKVTAQELVDNISEMLREAEWAIERLSRYDVGMVEDWLEGEDLSQYEGPIEGWDEEDN